MRYSLTYPGCTVCELLPTIPDDLKLAENEHWLANLRDNDQTLLGTSIIVLKRHAAELDILTQAEEQSFVTVRNQIITALRGAFNPLTFNISCLKNNAFKSTPDTTPQDASHVHWHIKPRYRSPSISFAGETFTDPLPGQYLSTFERKHISKEVAAAIAAAICEHCI